MTPCNHKKAPSTFDPLENLPPEVLDDCRLATIGANSQEGQFHRCWLGVPLSP